MAQAQGLGKRYMKAFLKGFFVAVPVTVTFLDRVACVARVEGASMQPSLNPGGRQASDVVLLNHWSIRNYDVQRGDIVSLVTYLDIIYLDLWKAFNTVLHVVLVSKLSSRDSMDGPLFE
ncbi:mitochondrial inner membrane protease subunit 2 isoform X4 [Apus apus]|uniref:mitochondrial inner membrane protease subunit 2 isoform X4 n=1 Tax=Apus apus TaxID=8895 RepID=UPI0021F8F3BB|nr:mitochondrial inner membrane protease subunit 2 isoform X4 [Apus apus]